MEIGSFIELDLKNTGEYYTDNQVERLNSARAGIVHACKLYGVSTIYIPYYQCPSVSAFLEKNGLKVLKYLINDDFLPVIEANDATTAFLLVNYFGIFSPKFIHSVSQKYTNVIIDNSQAFYSQPLETCLNIYSPRKFFGVPDGCYVIGNEKLNTEFKYPQDESSETSGFLLKRIEKGCSAVYAERMQNEERINNSGVLTMSKLTQVLLSAIDYGTIADKRRANFQIAHELYKSINQINPLKFYDEHCVPMVYPLVIRDVEMVKKLTENQVYTGRWWNSVLAEVNEDTFEAKLSRFMIPIPIDQRYSEVELKYVAELITD